MAQYDGSIRINTKIDTKDVPSQLMKLENNMQKAADKVSSLRQKMESLKDVQIPTQEYQEIQKQIEATENKINDLVARQEKFISTGGKESSSTYQKMQYDLDELRNSLPYLQGELQDLVDTGKAFTLGTDTEQYSKLGQELKYAENNLLALNRRHDELVAKQGTVSEWFSKMQNSAKKAFNAVASGTKKSSGLLSTFASRLKGLALSLLIFNWISKAFNAMISGMKTGFSNFAGYSDSYAQSVQNMKNAMSTLGNQFAAAFSPIVQMVIPWLNSLINAITAAMTYVAQFIAILGGKGMFTKAKQQQDAYNKSLGGTAKAADKARGALAKFDDLDVLQKQDDAGGGGGAGAGEDFKNMFEEVPVDTRLSGWIDEITEKLKELKDVFMQGFWDGLGDWGNRWEDIKENLQTIKDVILGIITDVEVLEAVGKAIEAVVGMIGTIIGSVASIILTIVDAVTGGIAKFLEQNEERIKAFIISISNVVTEISNLISSVAIAIAYVFEAFSSEQGQQLIANILGIIFALSGAVEFVYKLFRDLLEIVVIPFIENAERLKVALEGLLSFLEQVTGTIKQTLDETFDKLNEVYDEHFKPFFDSIANGLSRITEAFLKFWNENVQPILDSLSKKFDEVMSQHIQPMIDRAIELLGGLMDLLTVLWETVMVPLVEWIIENILPVILPIFEELYEGILEIVGYISDVISSMIEIMQGVIDFIVGVFTGDWDRAWKGISEIVTGFMNKIKSTIELEFTVIKTVVNTVLNIISAIWTSIFTGIGSFVKTITSAILATITGFMGSAKTGISTVLENIKATWSNIWTEMKTIVTNIFSEMWNAIKSAINNILGGVEKMANGFVSAINKIIDAINSLQIENPFTGEEIWSPNLSHVPTVSIPRLATGAVIRGGNPFMAILGDQPAGRTNIEAPLDTIKQAVREELSNLEFGELGGGTLQVVLNVNGEDLAQATLSNFLSEMGRQGYDVSVLGVA